MPTYSENLKKGTRRRGGGEQRSANQGETSPTKNTKKDPSKRGPIAELF